jgi:gliding motility-associated-like protein
MKNNVFFITLLLLFAVGQIHAGVSYPIVNFDGQTVESCSGSFVHSLGLPDSNYGPNENYSITFCSNSLSNPYIMLHFDAFQLGSNDTLYVYDGPDAEATLIMAATGNDLEGQSVSSSSECLHFHFVSSDFDPDDPDELTDRIGWQASISCYSICDFFVAEIDAPDGLMHCPETVGQLAFSASAEYLDEDFIYNPDNFEFSWQIVDETFQGTEVVYDFGQLDDKPGAYTVRVNVLDNRTGCETTAYKVVLIGTYPTFDETTLSADTVCAEESFVLTGVTNPTMWTGFDTGVEEDEPVFINQDNPYGSALTFDVFGDAVLSAPSDIDRVCITLEHEEYRHLEFHLRSPDNTLIQLKQAAGHPDETTEIVNLGEPVVNDEAVPGRGYEYCFSPAPFYGTMFETSPRQHAYIDNAGNYYAVAYFMPVDGAYTPVESFQEFVNISTPMDGTWTLYVEDTTQETSGHVFGWRLLFNEQYYPDSLIFMPEIVNEQWFHNGSALSGNPASHTLPDPGMMPETHEFLFEATDNFGCTYDTTLTITVLPLPKAEIFSEHELPVCEGDSTWFTVSPIDDFGDTWLYQWQMAAGDLPGSIYDTLNVKVPDMYTVMITDSITGCVDFFEKEFETQNCDWEIPNVFTPNGDGINDFFEIQIGESGQFVETFIPQLQIVIFNRHGRRVFEHNDYYNNWWDGDNVPDGTYFYVIQYARQGEIQYAEGSVTVIR